MTRTADHPIDPIFIDRRSPRAFTEDQIAEPELLAILEAARWAPSSMNLQPWRFVWARRGTSDWDRLLPILLPGNRRWAERSAALVFVASLTEREAADGSIKPISSHAYDSGIATGFLALQAHMSGWGTHIMGGIDADDARKILALPDGVALHTGIAIGRIGAAESLPEDLRDREVASDRNPLPQIAFEGRFPDK